MFGNGWLNLIGVSLGVALIAVIWGHSERQKRLTAEAEKATVVAQFAEAANINAGNRAVLEVLQVELAGCSERLARSLQRYADAERDHQARESARIAALRTTQQELNRVLQANRVWADTSHPSDIGRLLNAADAGKDRDSRDSRG